MARKNWSEAQRQAHAERMRRLNADPAFAARKAEAARSPDGRRRRAERMRQNWAEGALRRPDIPAGYEEAYAELRKKLGAQEALECVQAEARRRHGQGERA